jgi:IS30 family transposase
MGRYNLTDFEWRIIEALLPDKPLSGHTQNDLDIIAERLNNRPRKILDFLTPNEVFAKFVADAQATGQACCTST